LRVVLAPVLDALDLVQVRVRVRVRVREG